MALSQCVCSSLSKVKAPPNALECCSPQGAPEGRAVTGKQQGCFSF